MFAATLPHVQDDAGIYVWHAHVQQPTIAAAFERHGILLHQVLVGVKPVATFGHGYYRWKHEPCAFGWKRGNKPKHGFGRVETVWEADWDGRARITEMLEETAYQRWPLFRDFRPPTLGCRWDERVPTGVVLDRRALPLGKQ